jgi:hypothetical protein
MKEREGEINWMSNQSITTSSGWRGKLIRVHWRTRSHTPAVAFVAWLPSPLPRSGPEATPNRRAARSFDSSRVAFQLWSLFFSLIALTWSTWTQLFSLLCDRRCSPRLLLLYVVRVSSDRSDESAAPSVREPCGLLTRPSLHLDHADHGFPRAFDSWSVCGIWRTRRRSINDEGHMKFYPGLRPLGGGSLHPASNLVYEHSCVYRVPP